VTCVGKVLRDLMLTFYLLQSCSFYGFPPNIEVLSGAGLLAVLQYA